MFDKKLSGRYSLLLFTIVLKDQTVGNIMYTSKLIFFLTIETFKFQVETFNKLLFSILEVVPSFDANLTV